MRNKIVATIFLVASIILVIKSLNPLKIYNFVEKGNNFIKEEKYSNGREEYEKVLKLRENNQVKLNVLKSFYREKNYEEVTKSNVEEGFLKGNSYVYLGDNSQDKNKEFYEKALEEYKLAMKTSDDINIKKNYELTLKKLEDMSKQQNQDNQQNQEDNRIKKIKIIIKINKITLKKILSKIKTVKIITILKIKKIKVLKVMKKINLLIIKSKRKKKVVLKKTRIMRRSKNLILNKMSKIINKMRTILKRMKIKMSPQIKKRTTKTPILLLKI